MEPYFINLPFGNKRGICHFVSIRSEAKSDIIRKGKRKWKWHLDVKIGTGWVSFENINNPNFRLVDI